MASQPWWQLHSSVNILKTNELDTLIGGRVPWTARGSNQPILKEINPEYSLERLMLKLQYFGHLMQRAHSMEKALMLGKIEGKRRRGWQRIRWLDGITDSRDMNLSRLQEIVKGREAWCTAVPVVAESWRWLGNWTTIATTTKILLRWLEQRVFNN